MKVLTAFELAILVNELKSLIGAKVNKIHQPSPKELMIEFYSAATKTKTLKINSGIGMYITEYKLQQPKTPTSFCMFLRKNLNNAILKDIQQKGYERIIELTFKAKDCQSLLICELFSRGNFIFADENYKILNCAVAKELKDRATHRGDTYAYPETQNTDLSALTKKKLTTMLKLSKRDVLGAFLAADLGLGSTYSNEVCVRTKLDQKSKLKDAKPADLDKLFLAITKLTNEKLAPHIYFKNKIPCDAVPFNLKLYDDSNSKEFRTFGEALDEYYTSAATEDIKSVRKASYESKIKRLQKIIEEQRASVSSYKKQYAEATKIGETIYQHYGEVQDALAKGENKTVTLTIDGISFKVDGKKNVQQNAAEYYEKSKTFKEKIPGAESTVRKFEKQLASLQLKEHEIPRNSPTLPSKREERAKTWYEKFRWFFTSSGKLAVGGRDATSNEIVVKKHAEPSDIVFHTDLPGSPFFVLKGDEDLEEAAIATASFSRAWKEGFGSTEVYWVKPSQLTKGSSKGLFLVNGKRSYVKNECKLAIGLFEGKVMCGPASAIKKHCKKSVIIIPGTEKPSDVAKEITKILQIDKSLLDEVLRSLPSGNTFIASIS